jgi:hypothetical protein
VTLDVLPCIAEQHKRQTFGFGPGFSTFYYLPLETKAIKFSENEGLASFSSQRMSTGSFG